MPALAHLLCHWLLGAYAAWQCRRAPSLNHHLFGWPLMLAFTLTALFLVPLTTFQARMYPSYAAGYALDPLLYPQLFARVGPVTLALVLANMAAVGLGFTLARWGVLTHSRFMLWVPAGFVLTVVLAYLVSLGRRGFTYGSYHALWAQEAASFGDTPSSWFVPVAYAACLLGIFKVARRARNIIMR